MLGIFRHSIKAVASIVDIPISAAADVITLGGALTEKEKPYTAEACSNLIKNIKNITKSKDIELD